MIDEEALLKRTEDQTVYIALSKPNALTTRSLEALVGISWRSTATGKCDRLVAPERASEELKMANWGPWSKMGVFARIMTGLAVEAPDNKTISIPSF